MYKTVKINITNLLKLAYFKTFINVVILWFWGFMSLLLLTVTFFMLSHPQFETFYDILLLYRMVNESEPLTKFSLNLVNKKTINKARLFLSNFTVKEALEYY